MPDRGQVARLEAEVPEEERGAVWAKWLLGPVTPAVLDLEVALDEMNQRVVACDCKRTRCLHPEFDEKTQRLMERMLTCYCKQQNLKYKQGMNEVLAPFVFLFARGLVSVETCYGLFAAFMGAYMIPLYADDDFVGLQAAFGLFRGLLAYHLPRLYTLLEQHEVGPELYASWWLLTLYGSKTDLNVVMTLWDIYIAEDDATFFQFLGVAMLDGDAEVFGVDPAALPERLSNRGVGDVKLLCKRAQQLRARTPASFSHRVNMALDGAAERAADTDVTAFVTLASEVVRHCYGETAGEWRFLVVDLRPARQFNEGHFPMSINVPMSNPKKDAEIVKEHVTEAGGAQSGLHVVLVPPQPNKGLELYRALVAADVCHVSIVSGGFPAIDKCRAAGMDLIESDEGGGLLGSLFSQATARMSRTVSSARQTVQSASESLGPALSARLRMEVEYHNVDDVNRNKWITYTLFGESSKFCLLVASTTVILCRHPAVDHLNGKAFEEVGRRMIIAVHRITSKKEDARTLCFYFEDDTSTPAWVLQYDSKDSAQDCIGNVRSRYRALKKKA